MNIKNDLNYIKNELGSDNKILENAFKLEQIYRRHRRVIWALGAGILIAVIAYAASSIYTHYNTQKYSAIYDELSQNPSDTALRENLKSGNPKLYNLFLLQQALNEGNVNTLKDLGESKDTIVAFLAHYHLASFERDSAALERVWDGALGDLARLQSAQDLISAGKISEAKIILDKIPMDSSLHNIASMLLHTTALKDNK